MKRKNTIAYFKQAYIFNEKINILNYEKINFSLNHACIFNAIIIGTQVWLQENLKTTRYNNGDLIGTTTPATFDIRPESTPKYQWAYEGNESKADTFGRLYTWYAVTDSRGICPIGWHVPADAEWTTLTDFLGGTSVAGGKMKTTGTIENSNGL